jgi:hypothetical protein
MVREIDSCRLTDMQLEALGVLSIDYGLTNRELNRRLKESSIPSNLTEQELNKALEKIETKEGNFRRDATGPLLEKGIIYRTEGKYPNKLLYINKFIDNINKIQDLLADRVDGRIWHYDKIHYIEEKKAKIGEKPSEEHVNAHHLLNEFIHLYLWCDQIKRELDEIVEDQRVHFDSFCLITQIPPCKTCRLIQKSMKHSQHFQELNYILWKQMDIHSIEDLRKLAKEVRLIKKDREYRSLCREFGISDEYLASLAIDS